MSRLHIDKKRANLMAHSSEKILANPDSTDIPRLEIDIALVERKS